MIPALVVIAYLGVVLYIGIFAFRRAPGGEQAEGYFLANRSLGQYVFLLSLFGTNMTAFTILGSAGHAFANGIVTYGLMGSSSAFIIPVTLYLFGTRVWALGKRHGFMTPVQMYRDRWECGHIGTAIFALQAALLVPYIVIAVMGGGTTLSAVSGGVVPYWFGGAIVAAVVMSYVFFGGMRGTAWVNTFQTVLFLTFGAAAIVFIGVSIGGFPQAMERLLGSPESAPLLTRERIPPRFFFSYMLIPLSSIMFPHISIFCLTARRMGQFRKTVIFYPLCILAIWLPCTFLGLAANAMTDVPAIDAKLEARAELAAERDSLTAEETASLQRAAAGDDVIILMLEYYAPLWLAGLLGAGIMAAVMASDSQILALSTMFTEDVFTYYGGTSRFGPAVQVQTGRLFVVLIALVAYVIALNVPPGIFGLAVQYAFSGFTSMLPLLVAALFWRGSTKWGALAVVIWTAVTMAGIALLQAVIPAPPPGVIVPVWTIAGTDIITRTPGGTDVLGFMPVLPMLIGSSLLMVVVSWLTPKPATHTLSRYFPEQNQPPRP
ncbi:MAG: sodium:solute symporter family protein [Acidobacteria bacterium]|nr:sodium:solute symporter family protein [Acidobacteriota bacterium]